MGFVFLFFFLGEGVGGLGELGVAMGEAEVQGASEDVPEVDGLGSVAQIVGLTIS